ncbi:MAG: hypothetical protein B5M56_07040 [Desulfococcus sp. 4484_241]|nr:MAG: hypothetical protein B5M56_07040 [Desulfococcus sp. 4484_241]
MAETGTQQKILEAATAIFAQEGFRGARMRQIADLAGVNQALLHYYFRSKENLYGEVLSRFFTDVFSSLAHSLTTQADPESAFRSFIDTYIDILSSNPTFPRLMVSEILEGGRHLMAVVDRIFSETGLSPPGLVVPFVNDAIKKNLIRPVDPVQTSISVVGMCMFYFIAKPFVEHIWGKPENEPEFIRQRKEAIADLVLYGVIKRQE